jgi:hypothetical protein
VPLVPVTVTAKSPGEEAVQDKVAVAGEGGKTTLAGNVQARPAGVEVDTENITVPAKPLTEVTVIVEVPEEPASISAGVTTPAAMLKSGTAPAVTVTATVIAWVSEPLVLVTVTV